LLGRAGALGADPVIRRTVDQESTALVDESRGLMDRILFWQEPEEPGTLVDPEKEARRLREVHALGKPVNKGDVPVIERKERGWLEGIF
jgi:hypothetical protein